MTLACQPRFQAQLRWKSVSSRLLIVKVSHPVFGRSEQTRLLTSGFMAIVENSEDLTKDISIKRSEQQTVD